MPHEDDGLATDSPEPVSAVLWEGEAALQSRWRSGGCWWQGRGDLEPQWLQGELRRPHHADNSFLRRWPENSPQPATIRRSLSPLLHFLSAMRLFANDLQTGGSARLFLVAFSCGIVGQGGGAVVRFLRTARE